MRKLVSLLILGGIVLSPVIYGPAAFGASIVVNSQSDAYRVGAEISDDSIIELGAQQQMRVMDKDNGVTKVISGPYKGLISEYKDSCLGTGSVSRDCARAPRHEPIGASRALP